MDDQQDVQLYPVWRQAVKDFIAAEVAPGYVLPHEWIEAHFDMEPLQDGTEYTAAQFRQRQFEWLRNFEAFRSELLEEHQICLISEYGQGYRVVPPGEQTNVALRKFEQEIKRSFRVAALRTKHVQLDALTAEERKENVDGIAKLSALAGMSRKALR